MTDSIAQESVTKLRIPDVERRDLYSLKKIIIGFLQLKDVFIAERDIELDTHKTWNFYKLSLFRWSDAGSGCGSRKSRDDRWEIDQQEIRDLFDQYMEDDFSWRWLPHTGYDMNVPYDKVTDRDNFIVGRVFYIKKGPLILNFEGEG